MFLLKKVYKQLEIDNLSIVSSVGKGISYPYVSGKLMDRCPKICFRQFLCLARVLNLVLIFHQIPGSRSHEIFLIKKERNKEAKYN